MTGRAPPTRPQELPNPSRPCPCPRRPTGLPHAAQPRHRPPPERGRGRRGRPGPPGGLFPTGPPPHAEAPLPPDAPTSGLPRTHRPLLRSGCSTLPVEPRTPPPAPNPAPAPAPAPPQGRRRRGRPRAAQPRPRPPPQVTGAAAVPSGLENSAPEGEPEGSREVWEPGVGEGGSVCVWGSLSPTPHFFPSPPRPGSPQRSRSAPALPGGGRDAAGYRGRGGSGFGDAAAGTGSAGSPPPAGALRGRTAGPRARARPKFLKARWREGRGGQEVAWGEEGGRGCRC